MNPLKKKPVDGSKLINNAIGKFESIAAEIEAGVRINYDKINTNRQTIETLESENTNLSTAANYGARVATKLRELLT